MQLCCNNKLFLTFGDQFLQPKNCSMKVTIPASDVLGVIAGSLCLIHCMATPFLFVIIAGFAGLEDSTPLWWISMNYIFLVIGFLAVYRSVKTTSLAFMTPLFWISWIALSFVMINEQFHWIELSEFFSYLMASILIALHLYNRKHCKCQTDSCCVA